MPQSQKTATNRDPRMAGNFVDHVFRRPWIPMPDSSEIRRTRATAECTDLVQCSRALLMDVADMDAFQVAMQSESAAEAMAYDGVLPEALVILVEA